GREAYRFVCGDLVVDEVVVIIAAALRSAVEAEREACAKVAEADAATSRRRQWVNEAQRIGWELAALTGDTIAEAIRARGKA
ncbi:hypothetical protein IAI27_11160, partial [Streptococcus pseudopneumoniae]|uniref:hypothetical protein n=1 Tax=Streptococcus pseudopneumoniae TaxID=257758 RepID=UPI0018B08BCD